MKKKKTQTFAQVCRKLYIAALAVEIFEILSIVNTLVTAVINGENPFALIPTVISGVTMLLVYNFLRLIFRKLKTSETPFLTYVSEKINAIAYTLVGGGGVYFIATVSVLFPMSIVNEIPLTFTDDDFAFCVLWSGTVIMVGFIFRAIAYIFDYGCKLQQESDETL